MQKYLCLLLFPCCLLGATLPEIYPEVVEQLVVYKDDDLKIYNGGPVENGHGVTWILPALFEDQLFKVRAVYEISFINCDRNDKKLSDVSVYFSSASDIDIKFRNSSSKEASAFLKLVNNQDPQKRAIIIRAVDVANVCYPHMHVAKVYSAYKKNDLNRLRDFLASKYGVTASIETLDNPYTDFDRVTTLHIAGTDAPSILLERKMITVSIRGKNYPIVVDHYYIKDDEWKSYYIVLLHDQALYPNNLKNWNLDERESSGPKRVDETPMFVRLDSGCTSGQIYGDQACDCLDQLLHGIEFMAQRDSGQACIIHIPGHDGRGFGTAPKAETEIYKIGGKGRIHQTKPLDTIQAALKLYQSKNYDIRSYEGCGKFLAEMGIHHIELMTDNKKKIQAIEKAGLTVKRIGTQSNKVACEHHLAAKRKSNDYYDE